MSSAPLQRSGEEPAGIGRRTRLLIGLAGGSQSQRIAVKEVLAHLREIEVEIVDLGDEQPVSENDPKIALLALLLDPAERERWPAMFQIPHSNGPSPLMVDYCPTVPPI